MAQAAQLYPSLAGAEAAAGAAPAGAPVARFRCLAAAFWLFFCFLGAFWLPGRFMGWSLRFVARPSESELPAKSLSESLLSEPLSSLPLASEPSCSSSVSPNTITISSSILIPIFSATFLPVFLAP